jgi:hypothetical protein
MLISRKNRFVNFQNIEHIIRNIEDHMNYFLKVYNTAIIIKFKIQI